MDEERIEQENWQEPDWLERELAEQELSPTMEERVGQELADQKLARQDLKRLSRKDLIEVIYLMKKTELELRDRLDDVERQLLERDIRLQEAGSIAEAALSLNHVFEAVQAAADDYLRSVRRMYPPADQ